MSNVPSIVFSYIIFYRLRVLKTFLSNHKEIRKWIATIFEKIFSRKYENNNTWNIRHLVDKMFVPATQRPSVLCFYIEDSRILGYAWAWSPCPCLRCLMSFQDVTHISYSTYKYWPMGSNYLWRQLLVLASLGFIYM